MQSGAQKRLREIQEILREAWNPIGGYVPDDEYDSYGAEIYTMVIDGKGTAENLVSYLQRVEGENMGIHPNYSRIEEVVGKILCLDNG